MDRNELIENFALFDEWEERYAYLIEMGRKLPPMDDALKNEHTRVEGCTSQVWMISNGDQAHFSFLADSDSQIVRGLIAVLMAVYNDQPRQRVGDIDIQDIFAQLGLTEHLTPNRRNGFFAMVERIKALATF